MNDLSPKKKRKLLLPIIFLICAAFVFVFIASRMGLDKMLVKQKLDETIAMIKESGKEQGSDIDIQYGELEVTGGFLDKHVIVQKPILTIRPLERKPQTPADKPDSVVVTTEEIIIYPQSIDLSSAKFSFNKPVNFAAENAPDRSLLLIEASSPIDVSLTQKVVNDVPYTHVSHTAPATISLTYLREQKAEGMEDETPTIVPVYDTIDIAIADGSMFETEFANDGSELGKADVAYKQITLTPKSAPEGVITVAGVNFRWGNTLNDQKLNTLTATADVGPITAPEDVIPYAPIAFGLDFAFEGPIAKKGEEPSTEAPNASIVLKKFELSSKESNLSASANFTSTATDMLPVGTANAKVSNLPYVLAELRDNKILTPENEAWVIPILEQIEGAPIGTLTELDVPIKREQGGSFKIGNTTFEEIFAVVLKNAIQPKNGIPLPNGPIEDKAATGPQSRTFAPQLPAADKKRAAPIEVPDHGVRG